MFFKGSDNIRVVIPEMHLTEMIGNGLALVSELVKLHGGTISLTSVVDKGSTFTVTLPLGMNFLQIFIAFLLENVTPEKSLTDINRI